MHAYIGTHYHTLAQNLDKILTSRLSPTTLCVMVSKTRTVSASADERSLLVKSRFLDVPHDLWVVVVCACCVRVCGYHRHW